MTGEVGEEAVKVTWRAGEITLLVLLQLCEMIVKNRDRIQHGKQSLSKLKRQGRQLESVNLSGVDIQIFRRELRRYGVDYNIQREKETGFYHIYFKAQDVDRIHSALEKCVQSYKEGSKRQPIKEVMRAAEQKAINWNEGRTEEREARANVDKKSVLRLVR